MRLKLEIAYHGEAFNGWQSQPCGNTIQDHLEKAFLALTPDRTVVHGAGRTDAGVHAEAQCAHADVPDDRMTPRDWLLALNANLPEPIRIMDVKQVPNDFHARFSAKGKIYRYTIWNATAMHPLLRDRAWHVTGKLDMENLRSVCALFNGTHNFAAFSLRRTGIDENTERTIHSLEIDSNGGRVDLTFEGPGFLHKMVRILSAAIIRHSLGKISFQALHDSLLHGKPAFQHTAPADGLCLMRVLY